MMDDSVIEDIIKEADNLTEHLTDVDLAVPRLNFKAKKSKKVRRVAEPHIFSRIYSGKTYYFYADGSRKEVYLGTADAILRKVKNGKE